MTLSDEFAWPTPLVFDFFFFFWTQGSNPGLQLGNTFGVRSKNKNEDLGKSKREKHSRTYWTSTFGEGSCI